MQGSLAAFTEALVTSSRGSQGSMAAHTQALITHRPNWGGNARPLGCIDHIPTQLIREGNARLLGCIYTGSDHIPTQLGRE